MLENTKIVKDTYDVIAKFFAPMLDEENSSKAEVAFMESYLERLPVESTLIDLGCGAGKHGRYCAGRGHLVTGYDVSNEMIKRAKAYNEIYKMEFLAVEDMCEIKTTQMFDGVIAMYSLIHLTKDQTVRTFMNLASNIKEGAQIALCVNIGDGEGYFPEILKPDMRQYFKYYQKDELVEVVESVGIQVDDICMWKDEDTITASNMELEYGVIGIIGTWRGGKK